MAISGSVWRLLLIGLVFHLVYIGTVFDCYFTSPVVNGMQQHSLGRAEAKRLVLIVGTYSRSILRLIYLLARDRGRPARGPPPGEEWLPHGPWRAGSGRASPEVHHRDARRVRYLAYTGAYRESARACRSHRYVLVTASRSMYWNVVAA